MIQTKYGIEIPCPDKKWLIGRDSDRKLWNSIWKINEWLIRQAQYVANLRDDQWNAVLFEGLDPKNIHTAQIELMNNYLFGEDEYRFPEECYG